MIRKILLAEDDLDDRIFFHDFLHKRDDLSILSILVDGVELTEYLDKNKSNDSALPDIIILDQNMPRRNGLQTLELLKASADYSLIPVIVYSTYANDFLVKKSLALGAAGVFQKPQDREEYNSMMDELFKLIP